MQMNDAELVLSGVAIRWRRAVLACNEWKATRLMAWYRELKGDMNVKKIMGLMLLLVAVGAQAETLNPDKYPSMGLNWNRSGISGDASATVLGSTASEDITGSSNLIVADFRLPISNNLTLSAELGGVFSSQSGSGSFSTSDASSKGVVTGLGVRYYFIGR